MNTVARVLLGALAPAVPAFAVLAVLAIGGWLAPGPALAAAIAIYAGVALLLAPLIGGILGVRNALDRMAANEPAPEVRSLSPSVRELWLALGRWARNVRAEIRARDAALDSARSVLAALPEPLLLLDAGRRVVRANAAATALFGAHIEGRDLAGALRHPLVLAASDQVLKGEAMRAVEFELTSPVERHLRALVARLVPEAEGAAAVLVLHDLTELKRTERLRADFVANASHELRTPLATLVGFIETLRGTARDDSAARDRFLGIMAEQGARMTRLVEDLLSLSRIEMNEHRPPTEAVQVETALRQAADPLEPRAKARGMRFVYDIAPDLPPVIGDGDELVQVFQNLFDNAIKYGDQGTAIEVVARPSTKALPGTRPGERVAGVAIAVHDYGPGIAHDHIPRLTERFYRVDAARSRALGGTGLGLAIVKHIVSHHRGVFEIDSELGQGSTFTVHLPVAASQKIQAGTAA
ncbi:MAG: PAS domain-containing protein [Alphaproteobacteria bacterium]|nr:PAS domain-containing protein [Alphaproteobacteria bacterium]